MKQNIKIALFASGSGSNVENVINYFKERGKNVDFLIYCNNSKAGVLERATRLGVSYRLFDKNELYENGSVVNELLSQKVDWVVLAGFLWLIPQKMIQLFPNRIINIHPALLPSYGGKGMYGNKVHEAVERDLIKGLCHETGITIHYVNEHYDEGAVIFQAKVELFQGDSAATIAEKVHGLEFEFFPKVIESLIENEQ